MRTFLLILIMTSLAASADAQVLTQVNYFYQCDASKGYSFQMNPVRLSDQWMVFYKLAVQDTSKTTDDFTVTWEMRTSLDEKSGPPITKGLDSQSEKFLLSGSVSPGLADNQQIIVAKVVNKASAREDIYYRTLDPHYPVNSFLRTEDGKAVLDSYIIKGSNASIQGFSDGSTLMVSYYNDFFPTAAPAFSEGQAKVAKAIKADSIFTTTANQTITFKSAGLYLVQSDTTTGDGLAFRVEDGGYPKFKRVQDLVGPFIYICTREEFQNLRMTGSDKKEFDRQVLGITRDRERAQNFMRTYFRRAEAANSYFTSYKEGWKTDRGMMYIIYGLPDRIYKFADREVWTYGKTNFNFIKSSTLFDPDNYVLIRSEKYTDQWYEKVDLVRNGRF